jgi:hypothetical protein
MLATQLVTVGCIQLPHLGVPSIAFESAYRVKYTAHSGLLRFSVGVSTAAPITDHRSLLLVNKGALFCESWHAMNFCLHKVV